ncbi:hypothetical protein LI328DRAFT_127470 [Trichoderma asperelloides]|nr:hypothetical protein LI328DRAFT_127470 [Trichoderma asperelloides]
MCPKDIGTDGLHIPLPYYYCHYYYEQQILALAAGKVFKELLGAWTVDDLHNNGRLASFSFVPLVYTLANFLSLVILFYTLTSTHFISSVRLIHNMRVKAEERHSLRLVLFYFILFFFLFYKEWRGEGESNLHFIFY